MLLENNSRPLVYVKGSCKIQKQLLAYVRDTGSELLFPWNQNSRFVNSATTTAQRSQCIMIIDI